MPEDYVIWPGSPSPLGNHAQVDGTNFAIFSAHAEAIELCLFSSDGEQEVARLRLPARTGDIWHGFVPDLKPGQLYGYRVHGPYAPEQGHRFNANKLLIDPYALQLSGDFTFDEALFGFDRKHHSGDMSFDARDSAPFMPKCVVGAVPKSGAEPAKPNTPWTDTVLYEAHVKGATVQHSGVTKKLKGTFEGLSSAKMIAHMQKMGVTAVELMPVHASFSEPRLTEMRLNNYWGYNSISFFAPNAAFIGPAGVQSFRKMVRAFHKAGIEVILDVVFNHTAESWELGPTLSFRGIDNASYYRLAEDKRYYSNETGCGNVLNMDQPHVLKLVMDSLRYWVDEMEVDGFRFDLATTLARSDGHFDSNSSFLRALQQDPLLSRVKLIAEPWDIGHGGYQLGAFPSFFGEWNDKYRDTVRRFWKGERFVLPALADALLGSAGTFEHNSRESFRSINYVASHDGFTLNDLVSYNDRHNWANGEDNRDGHSHNLSDNCGAEGESKNVGVLARRAKRMRNLLTTVMVSQGTPMLLAGDEFGNSQQGNNNAYCQDNEISWLDWKNADETLMEFVAGLARLRKHHPVLRRPRFLHGQERSGQGLKDITWIAETGNELQPDEWHHEHRHTLGMMLCGDAGNYLDQEGASLGGDTLLIVFNNGFSDVDFHLPLEGDWTTLLNTAADQPFASQLVHGSLLIPGESALILACDGTGVSRTRVADGVSELAAHYGVVDGFYDLSGQNHIASQDTKRALLEAMGLHLKTVDGLNSALAAKHSEETAILPPTMVLVKGGDTVMPIQLPATDVALEANWMILLESGERRKGSAALVPAGAVHGRGSNLFRSYTCTLPPDLPLGYHRFILKTPIEADCHLIVAPERAESLRHAGKQWGLMVPLYGLKSDQNLGIGDFDDLATAAEFAASQGADFVGLNPVHALFPKSPDNRSPYSPSSRTFLNVLHIAPHLVPELTDGENGKAFLKKLIDSDDAVAARNAEFVDYEASIKLKFEACMGAFRIFDALPDNHLRKLAFASFCDDKGEPLKKHALFDALSEHFLDKDPELILWQQWPEAYRDHSSDEVAAFAEDHSDHIRFYMYLQWVADTQLTLAQSRAKAAGMSIGIYLDLAVGMVPGGAETWGGFKTVANGVSLGAPPDAASPAGQVWDLAPLNPHRLAETGYRHFVTTIRSIMGQSGLVRIDHILGINRSFWVPEDRATPGAYVNYPLDDLIAIIALESQRAGCAVIGEDLGTVPDGLRPKLNGANIFGCALMYFEQDENGHFLAPADYRASTLASISNHDFPTLAGYWSGRDFAWRRELGIGDNPEQLAIDEGKRFADKCRLMAMLQDHDLLPVGLDPDNPPEEMTEELSIALHELLGRTRSLVAACQLEDLLGLHGQPNVPGTKHEQPNWRRKIPVAVNELSENKSIVRHMQALHDARRTG